MPPIKSNRGGCFRNTYRQTLWTACATVIVGVALMALGLLMTVVGYFDSNLFSSGEPLLVTTDSDSKVAVQGKGNGPDSAFGWLRLLLKSMQYVGPVLMGIGMFLMIIACVMTLESRDRHAQIIQEESTELRRSRRQTVQRTRSERSRTNDGDEMVKENGAATGLKREDPEKRSAIMRTNQSQLLVRAEVHPWSAPIRPTRPPVDFSLISEASSTDAMGEYTFPNIKTSLSGGGGGRKRREAEPKMPMRDETKGAETGGGERRGMEPAEGQHQQRHMALAGPRRKSSSAIVRINRNTPRGPAPLVRFESLIELSIAGSSPPSTFGSPRKKGQI